MVVNVPCKICTSLTPFSRRRYGGLCCNSCAAFFIRSIADEGTFECIGTNNCVKVPSPFAKVCRRCRFDKCIEIGMSTVEWIKKVSNNSTKIPKEAITPVQNMPSLIDEIEKCTVLAKTLDSLFNTSLQFPTLLEQYLKTGDLTLFQFSANFVSLNAANSDRINLLTSMLIKYPISQDEFSIFGNICLCYLEFKLLPIEEQFKFKNLQGMALSMLHQQNPNLNINRFLELITFSQRFLYIFYAYSESSHKVDISN